MLVRHAHSWAPHQNWSIRISEWGSEIDVLTSSPGRFLSTTKFEDSSPLCPPPPPLWGHLFLILSPIIILRTQKPQTPPCQWFPPTAILFSVSRTWPGTQQELSKYVENRWLSGGSGAEMHEWGERLENQGQRASDCLGPWRGWKSGSWQILEMSWGNGEVVDWLSSWLIQKTLKEMSPSQADDWQCTSLIWVTKLPFLWGQTQRLPTFIALIHDA